MLAVIVGEVVGVGTVDFVDAFFAGAVGVVGAGCRRGCGCRCGCWLSLRLLVLA